MALELSTTDAETKTLLEKLADQHPDNTTLFEPEEMSGGDAIALLVENLDQLLLASSALVIALRNKVEHLKISKEGLELSGKEKVRALDSGS